MRGLLCVGFVVLFLGLLGRWPARPPASPLRRTAMLLRRARSVSIDEHGHCIVRF